MEAGTRICPRCGLRRLTETECPACGAPTHLPYDPESAPLPEGAAGKPVAGSPLLGLAIALLGAVTLLVALSLPWYVIEVPSGLRGLFQDPAQQFGLEQFTRRLEANAWEAFGIADIALACAAGATFLLVAATLMGKTAPAGVARLLQLIGGFVIGVTLYRMIDQPEPALLLGVEAGAYVAIAAGITIVLGSGLTAAAQAR